MLLSTSTSAEIQTVYFRRLQKCGTFCLFEVALFFFCSPSEIQFYDWKIFKVHPCLYATKQMKADILEQYFSSQTLFPNCVCSTGRQNKCLSRGGRTGVAMAACKPQLNERTHSWVANFYCRPRLPDEHVREDERAAGSQSSAGYWAQLQSKYIPSKWRAARVAAVIVGYSTKAVKFPGIGEKHALRYQVSHISDNCRTALFDIIRLPLNGSAWCSMLWRDGLTRFFMNFAGCKTVITLFKRPALTVGLAPEPDTQRFGFCT